MRQEIFLSSLFFIVLFAGYNHHVETVKEYQNKMFELEEESFEQGFEKGRETHPLNPSYNKNDLINFTGNITLDDYRFGFSDNLSVYGRAHTDENFIQIRSNRTAEKIENTCTHEVIHFRFPEYEHNETLPDDLDKDPVYYLQDKTILPICRSLVREVVKRQ